MSRVRWSATRAGVVVPVPIDVSGARGPTVGQARGPRWRTTSRGLHVPAATASTTDQRIAEAAAVLREDEAVTGWAALHWRRAPWFDGTVDGIAPRDVPLVARRHLVAQPGFSVSQEFLHPRDIEVVDGLPLTRAVRSVVFEMRYAADLGAAVEAIDMACYSDLVSIAEVVAYVAQLGPVTGIQRARDALAEAEENSWSPRETRMRGVWIRRAGLPRPRCNVPVFDLAGRHVGTPDLIDPVTAVVGLYHGDSHLTLVGASGDAAKEDAYRDLGLEPVAMLAPDWIDLVAFTARLRAAARRAARNGPRGWTLTPPDWWTTTDTVEKRRALTARQREKYLRYRRAA